MAAEVRLDVGEWHDHAQWWEAEGPRIREELSVTPTTLSEARSMFGRIGSSTVGAALQELLQARAAAGHALGRHCEGVGQQIRTSLASYTESEEASQRSLRT
ncbi:hypothetical protein [Mycobacterium sp.]|uniref:hypothetical protein n=1 Tax=Mycobacterium sp. TaxID=1785 RepID=UPI000CB7276F|nr:hypothetical protein [Mycobacterium sp.]PJE05521.1 MAG: hypothetical protein CK428_26080 [Mycobacterium sp.]